MMTDFIELFEIYVYTFNPSLKDVYLCKYKKNDGARGYALSCKIKGKRHRHILLNYIKSLPTIEVLGHEITHQLINAKHKTKAFYNKQYGVIEKLMCIAHQIK